MHNFVIIRFKGFSVHFVTNTHFGNICLNKIWKIFWQSFYTKFTVNNTQSTTITNTTRVSCCTNWNFHSYFFVIKNLVKIDVKNTVSHWVKLYILKNGINLCATWIHYNGVYVWSVNQVFKCNFLCCKADWLI